MIIKSATPISRPLQPRFHEGSALRSPLDADSVDRQWIKGLKTAQSTFGVQMQLAKMEREISKLRRRIIGGQSTSTTSPSPPGNYAGNYDFNTAYSPGTIVRNLAGVLTIFGTQYYVQPGVYGCVVLTLIPTEVGWTKSMLPQYPEPATGPVFWQLIAFSPQAVNVCSNGNRNIYIETSGPF